MRKHIKEGVPASWTTVFQLLVAHCNYNRALLSSYPTTRSSSDVITVSPDADLPTVRHGAEYVISKSPLSRIYDSGQFSLAFTSCHPHIAPPSMITMKSDYSTKYARTEAELCANAPQQNISFPTPLIWCTLR